MENYKNIESDRFKDLKPIYKVGDVFDVVCWDAGDEVWQYGIIQLTEINNSSDIPKYQWNYSCISLSGNILWAAVGMSYFQETKFSLQKKYLGNVYNDPAIKVLYASK